MTEGEKKEGKKEEKKDEKKDEKTKDDDKIVMEAHMHCESCRYKVYKAIIGYPGVEDINIDMKAQKVTLKGKVDAKKLFETVKKKSGNKVTKLVSYPEPKKDDGKKEQKKDDSKKEEKKKEPQDVTVVLKVQMHCGACTRKVEKAIWKIPAVYNVKVEGEKVTIKGKDLDPKKVCEEVMCRSGKHAEVVPQKKEEKKEGEKKDGDKKDGDKKDGDKKDKASNGNGESKKDNKDKKDSNESKKDTSETKKEGGNAGKEEGGKKKEKDGGDNTKKEEKIPIRCVTEYVYAPQYFSDENPNACVVM